MNVIEELQWKQKVGNNWILQGDANTQFFHQFVNGRRRKKTITFLENGNEEIRGQNAISSHIVDYYKGLFGPEPRYNFRIDPTIWDDCENLEDTDNLILCQSFSEIEIKMHFFQWRGIRPMGLTRFPLNFTSVVGTL